MDVDRYTADNPFNPLIWEPEKYPIGVDESEERAARVAKARPKLGAVSQQVAWTGLR